MLECIPDEKLAWKPHEKSKTLGGLANHVAALPASAAILINRMQGSRPPEAKTKAELLTLFESCVSKCRAALTGAGEEQLSRSLMVAPNRSRPLPEILRDRILNHMIHHRGQLCVYLRLLDVSVPGMYGQSGDEK
jgi:uncharacterized damage-inducible protein DinB